MNLIDISFAADVMALKAAVIILLLLPACTKPFQPPKPDYQMWSKNRVNEIGVKKALLECGSPSPTTNLASYEHAFHLNTYDEIMNRVFLVGLCMEASGFVHAGSSIKESCDWYPKYKKYPACQPDVDVPVASDERRLASWHCKLKTDYEYCLKNAPNPKACNPEGHKKPPSECLP